MKTTAVEKRRTCLVLGGMGLLLASGYLWMSFQLPFGAREKPGAALFPVIVGIILCFASLAVIREAWKMDRDAQINLPAGLDRRRLLSVIGLILGYFLAMDLLGQIITSTVFCILLVRLLSEISWPRVLAYSLVMSIVLNVVFIVMFKIPMPRGILIYYLYYGN